MKYALTYHHTTFEKGLFDEVIIKYDKNNTNVIAFAQEEAKDVRLVLNMRDYEWDYDDDTKNALPTIQMLASVHNNIAIMLNIGQAEFAQELMKLSIPFFYDKIAETWDELVSLVYVGVSDIYIGSELGFEMKDVTSMCHSRNIKVRAYPNVAQTSAPFKNMPNITSFFIRPEDLHLYEGYIDIIQFFGPLDRQKVLHQIYIKETWLGNLSDIIIGLDIDVQNRTVANPFADIRLNCKKRCNQNKCNLCHNVQAFAQTLGSKGLVLTKEKRAEDEANKE